jgi:large subunit ribosomal protein L23
MRPEQVIRKPIGMTEKAAALRGANNQVIFEVDPKANKIQIRSAVEKLFEVKVVGVNTLVQRGKTKRSGRNEIKRPNWKKAIVTLRAGDDIQFFAESEEKAEE